MPGKSKRRLELPPEVEQLRIITLREAAALSSLSKDVWLKRYRHLLVPLSPRRYGVRLKDALSPPVESLPAA